MAAETIEAFLFDLGNVLLYFSHERMCAQVAQCAEVEPELVRQVLFESGMEWRYEAGQITSEQLHREFEARIGRPVDFTALRQAASDIFWPNESIEPVIAALRDQRYPLVLISNTNEAHFEWVEQRFPIVAQFPRRALSHQVGACKPDRRIYDAAVRHAGVPAQRCLYVDDIADYVRAAGRLGIDGVHFTGTESLVAELAGRGILPCPPSH